MNRSKTTLCGLLSALSLMACEPSSPPNSTETGPEVGSTSQKIQNGVVMANPELTGVVTISQSPLPPCSGVLIANQWVLTASHCLTSPGQTVQMGSQTATVVETHNHPNHYNDTTTFSNHALPRWSAKLIKLSVPL